MKDINNQFDIELCYDDEENTPIVEGKIQIDDHGWFEGIAYHKEKDYDWPRFVYGFKKENIIELTVITNHRYNSCYDSIKIHVEKDEKNYKGNWKNIDGLVMKMSTNVQLSIEKASKEDHELETKIEKWKSGWNENNTEVYKDIKKMQEILEKMMIRIHQMKENNLDEANRLLDKVDDIVYTSVYTFEEKLEELIRLLLASREIDPSELPNIFCGRFKTSKFWSMARSYTEKLEKYADLLLKECLNITDEKSMLIAFPTEAIELVRIIARKAYGLGVTDIHFDLVDEELKHDQLKNLEMENLRHSQFYNKEIYNEYAKKDAAFLRLMEGDSDLMNDIDPNLLSQTEVLYRNSQKDYKDKQLTYQIPWCIAAVATDRWAEKVFPNQKDAKEKLWNIIFECCFINENNPVALWKEKIKTNQERAKLLNAYRFQELHYQNNAGTDLRIELPEKHIWSSAGNLFANKKTGIVNLPTEEVFTSPKCDGVNGTVYSSKPLVCNGGIIEDFYLVFENGCIIDCGARVGEDLLKSLITSTENANRLGEVALVDYNSPISESNIIFYNTLFDENASCHLALGKGFPKCVENGEKMTIEELEEQGINYANIHQDFMIGTKDLTITGTTKDKQKVKVFEKGNFILK